MSLCKRKNIWWIRFSHQGKRIQQSTGTSDKVAAQKLHDQVKADIWRKSNFQERPNRTWMDAVVRWLEEAKHKRSLKDDKMHLRWLDPYLKHTPLNEVTRDKIDKIAKLKENTGVTPATVNRMLALIRAILRKSEREWEWIDNAPVVRLRKEKNQRIRWLTQEQAEKLLQELPSHLADMAAFTLATGLRRANVTGLKWEDIDLIRCHALVHPDNAKAGKAIPVPLNEDAIAILSKRRSLNDEYVFTYHGERITQCSTKAWRNALKRSGIENFRWHDLRHTWASWHVQNGTTSQELQQLGGWASHQMVLRYAHLSSSHLKSAAERITGTNLVHRRLEQNQSDR